MVIFSYVYHTVLAYLRVDTAFVSALVSPVVAIRSGTTYGDYDYDYDYLLGQDSMADC